MSRFNYLSDSLANMWKKKDSDVLSASANLSKQRSAAGANNGVKTPPKLIVLDHNIKVKRTPTKTTRNGLKLKRTPNKPLYAGGDRFIPCRSNTNFDMAHFMIVQNNKQLGGEKIVVTEQQAAMSELVGNALGTVPSSRVLVYNSKAPDNNKPLKAAYTQAQSPPPGKGTRQIPEDPDRILDAPEIVNDFYLSLLDWSSENIVAIGLGSQVYLWNSESGAIQELLELESSDYVCSVKWGHDPNIIAVGTSLGVVEIWDSSKLKRLRNITGHTGRVASLSWNNFVLSSGSRTGQIMHSDVRKKEHTLSVVDAHSQEVCGLTWSPDGKYLASGGNDNILNVWAVVRGRHHAKSAPLHTFDTHQAAVKAVAWCPWAPHILASGGGTADGCINVWNVITGTMMSRTDTQSQVSALVWAPEYKELVSGHGRDNNQVMIWKYPSMKKQTELLGHSARILQLALSPDGTTLLSAGADETLRFWKCFTPDPHKKKGLLGDAKQTSSLLRPCIR